MVLMEVRDLNKSFGGVHATSHVSLDVAEGELHAIIGPNGAGKTTMMDVITGKTRPDAGTILFKGTVDLTKSDETDIANLGIGRKFQKPTIFEQHTVFENLELALAGDRSIFASLFFRLDSEQRDRVDTVLDTIALKNLAYEEAGSLSHGQKQWLEIGMLLIQDPELRTSKRGRLFRDDYGSLFTSYDGAHWYFESVEMLKKMNDKKKRL